MSDIPEVVRQYLSAIAKRNAGKKRPFCKRGGKAYYRELAKKSHEKRRQNKLKAQHDSIPTDNDAHD